MPKNDGSNFIAQKNHSPHPDLPGEEGEAMRSIIKVLELLKKGKSPQVYKTVDRLARWDEKKTVQESMKTFGIKYQAVHAFRNTYGLRNKVYRSIPRESKTPIIIILSKAGVKAGEIARQLKVSRALVYNVISRNGKKERSGATPLNVAAQLLGKRGGLKGGHARASKLSPERRSEIASKAAKKRWDNQVIG